MAKAWSGRVSAALAELSSWRPVSGILKTILNDVMGAASASCSTSADGVLCRDSAPQDQQPKLSKDWVERSSGEATPYYLFSTLFIVVGIQEGFGRSSGGGRGGLDRRGGLPKNLISRAVNSELFYYTKDTMRFMTGQTPSFIEVRDSFRRGE